MPTAWIPKFTWNTHAGADVFEFPDPPVGDPQNEEIEPDQAVFIAASGKPAVQLNNITATYRLRFQWLSETNKDDLQTFLHAWAAYGKVFRYYPDKDEVDYYEVYTLKPKWKWGRPIPDGAGDFVYDFEIELYRVVQ